MNNLSIKSTASSTRFVLEGEDCPVDLYAQAEAQLDKDFLPGLRKKLGALVKAQCASFILSDETAFDKAAREIERSELRLEAARTLITSIDHELPTVAAQRDQAVRNALPDLLQGVIGDALTEKKRVVERFWKRSNQDIVALLVADGKRNVGDAYGNEITADRILKFAQEAGLLDGQEAAAAPQAAERK